MLFRTVIFSDKMTELLRPINKREHSLSHIFVYFLAFRDKGRVRTRIQTCIKTFRLRIRYLWNVACTGTLLPVNNECKVFGTVPAKLWVCNKSRPGFPSDGPHLSLNVEEERLLAKVGVNDLPRGLQPHRGVQVRRQVCTKKITICQQINKKIVLHAINSVPCT